VEIYNNFQNTNSLKKRKGINFKNKTIPIQQMTDEGLKIASGAIASLGIASLALNPKKPENIESVIYEECPEIVRAMSRFTPEELSLFAKSENYENIEFLSALQFITSGGKKQYRFTAQEILELANIENIQDFILLAETECFDPQTKKYHTRYSNDELKAFINNKVNFKLIAEYGPVLVNANTDKAKFPFYPTIISYTKQYEKNAIEIEEGIKNIEDSKLRSILELQYNEMLYLPIEQRLNVQTFLLKKIDAYNSLTGKYITFKPIGKTEEPQWLNFINYCREKNIKIKNDDATKHLYLDFLEQQRIESLIEACNDNLSKNFEFY